MEQEIAIMMADLSGYTALTETHGYHSAADLIDKYLQIVEKCLVGDSQLYSVVGDEVIITSASADVLLSTASRLFQSTAKEHLFLKVHGGLHYGPILFRNNHYFGTTINLTARITNGAHSGSFWCSQAFIKALSRPSIAAFESKGKHQLKNIAEEMELFEVKIDQQKEMFIDPICRMLLDKEGHIIAHPQIEHLYFCSEQCLEIYIRNQEGNELTTF